MQKPKNISPSRVPIFILAGGMGTRISEETQAKPKPMIEIGRIPLLIHIMRHYFAFGFNDFVICAGYRSLDIKKYFLDYRYHLYDLEIDQRDKGNIQLKTLVKETKEEAWRVRIIDTGESAMTGCRVAKSFDIAQRSEPFEHFGLTYGDGLSDANLSEELNFHLGHGKVGTVLGTKNLARYGELDVSQNDQVTALLEKPQSRQGLISGGFFFFRSDFRKYLTPKEDLVLEKEPLSKLANDGELFVYKHPGFWYAMDTLRDKLHLEGLWNAGNAPWVIKDKLTKVSEDNVVELNRRARR